MALYSTGQPFRLSTPVKDIAGALADPGALLLTYVNTAPGSVAVVKHWPSPAEITRDSLGLFHFEVPAGLTAGHYRATWTSSGVNAGEDTDVFDVFDPATYPRLVSFEDAKAYLRLTGTNDDAMLDRIIGWASARILREVQGTVQTRTDRVSAQGRVFTLPLVPVQAVTAITPVTPYSSAVDVATLYVRNALGGLIESYPTWLCGLYDVTYTAGYATVPAGVDGACLDLIRHWWNQSQAHGSATYGDSGFVPDFEGLPNSVRNKLAAAPARPPLIA